MCLYAPSVPLRQVEQEHQAEYWNLKDCKHLTAYVPCSALFAVSHTLWGGRPIVSLSKPYQQTRRTRSLQGFGVFQVVNRINHKVVQKGSEVVQNGSKVVQNVCGVVQQSPEVVQKSQEVVQ